MSLADLEARLSAAYEREAVFYSRALTAAGRWLDTLRSGNDPASLLVEVDAALAEVGAIEGEIAGLKNEWLVRRGDEGPGERFGSVLTAVAESVASLRSRIAEGEAECRRQAAALLPAGAMETSDSGTSGLDTAGSGRSGSGTSGLRRDARLDSRLADLALWHAGRRAYSGT